MVLKISYGGPQGQHRNMCSRTSIYDEEKCIEVEHMVNIANRDTSSTEIYFQSKYIFNGDIFSTEIF